MASEARMDSSDVREPSDVGGAIAGVLFLGGGPAGLQAALEEA